MLNRRREVYGFFIVTTVVLFLLCGCQGMGKKSLARQSAEVDLILQDKGPSSDQPEASDSEPRPGFEQEPAGV